MDLLPFLAAVGASAATLLLVVASAQVWRQRRIMQLRSRRFLTLSTAPPAPAPARPWTTVLVAAGRWVAQHRGSALLGLAMLLLVLGGLLGLAWTLVTPLLIGGGAGIVWLEYQRQRERRALLEAQLAPALQTMAAAMESGASLVQALQRVVEDAPDPIAQEFAQVLRAIELGQPLQAALDALAERTRSGVFHFFATILAVQHRVGGDLPGLLMSLAATIHERLQLQAELRALTAQARFSGWVLAVLPFVVVGVMLMASPSYISPLFNTEAGRVLLLFALVLLGVGLLSIRILNRVEI